MRTQILLDYVIKPSLKAMGERYSSMPALQLLLVTVAVESSMGKYIKQVKGPALGIFQIEPDSHKDLWDNFINFNPEIKSKLLAMLPDNARGDGPFAMSARHNCLISNMAYSACIARLIYFRYPDPMPSFDDKDGMWEFYKKRYNSSLGATTKDKFLDSWKRFIDEVDY